MALYAISDLHLSFAVNKPMDIFGEEWKDYMQKIESNWLANISDDDYIIIPGDISWATYLEEAYNDFEFINRLPGTKIILKGNHDYWWETANKLSTFIQKNNFNKIKFLHNNSVAYEDTAICGTRGWVCPNAIEFSKEDEKIYNRELIRLELSLKSIEALAYSRIIVALHYPPVNKNKDMNSGFIEILKKYKVEHCVYGHLHSDGRRDALEGLHEGVMYNLVSCDHIAFKPLRL